MRDDPVTSHARERWHQIGDALLAYTLRNSCLVSFHSSTLRQ
jgi:hypothetical protein